MTNTKIGRNESCPCGSGKKYKNCCGSKQQNMSSISVVAFAAFLVVIVAVLFYTFTSQQNTTERQVWDPEHGHYHTSP